MDPSQTSGDSELFRQRVKERSSPVPSIVLAIAGLVATGLAVHQVRESEEQCLRERFARIVQADRSLIYSVVSRQESALFSLRLLFASSERITRDEFRLAAKDLLAENRSISALEWIPRVPDTDRRRFEEQARAEGATNFFISDGGPGQPPVRAAERREHWPILYAEPLEGNSAALGYDLAGGPTVADIEAARDTGQTRLTLPVKLRQEMTERKSLIAILPVYAPNQSIETVEGRRTAFRGVVEGITRVDDFFTEVYEDRRDLPYALAVFLSDLTDGPVFEMGGSRWKAGSPIRVVEPLNIGQRGWRFEFEATPEWVARGRS